jgi:hypothetical protein
MPFLNIISINTYKKSFYIIFIFINNKEKVNYL